MLVRWWWRPNTLPSSSLLTRSRSPGCPCPMDGLRARTSGRCRFRCWSPLITSVWSTPSRVVCNPSLTCWTTSRQQCAPDAPERINPAKQLARQLYGTLPMIWGSSDLAGIVAYRLLCQLAENAKYPSVNGVLPEALHNQVVTFAAPSASSPPIRLVLLRDTVEHEQVALGADEAVVLARESGVPVSLLVAVGEHPLERMASLCAVGDFASVYLGVLEGVDPTPIDPITTLKSRLLQRQS